MTDLPTLPNPAAMRVTSLLMPKMAPSKLSILEIWQPTPRFSSTTI